MCLAGCQAIFHAPPNVSLPSALLASAGFAGALGAMWGLRRRVPLLLFGAGWFLVLLVPAALPLLSDTGSAVAEHRAYLPVAGFAVAIAGATSALARVARRGIARVVTTRPPTRSGGLWYCGLMASRRRST